MLPRQLLILGAATWLGSLISADRTIVIKNQCSYTIWPAYFTSSGTSPDHPTGWEAAAGSSETLTLSEGWHGRFWGRTNCDFSGDMVSSPLSCLTGGCNGGLLCSAVGGTGVPPCTVAEMALSTVQGSGLVDFYDVSAVDGTNIPLNMENSAGCPTCKCDGDLNPTCPTPNRVTAPGGTVVGCKSDCATWPTNTEYCCSGANNLPSTCPASGIPDYAFFKQGCPDGYVYAYDDANNALFSCASNLNPDYTMVFCPDSASTTATTATTSAPVAQPTTTTKPAAATTTAAAVSSSPAAAKPSSSSSTVPAAAPPASSSPASAASAESSGSATYSASSDSGAASGAATSGAASGTSDIAGSSSALSPSSAPETSPESTSPASHLASSTSLAAGAAGSASGSSSNSTAGTGKILGVNDSTAELIGGIIFALLVIALITGIWFVHGRNAKKGKKGAAAGDSSDGSDTEKGRGGKTSSSDSETTDSDGGAGAGKASKTSAKKGKSKSSSSSSGTDAELEKRPLRTRVTGARRLAATGAGGF